MVRPNVATVSATLCFFASAVGFFIAGLLAFGISWWVSGTWNPAQPAFIAGTHAFLLGGLMSIYLGAAHQLYPVISESRWKGSGWTARIHAALHPLGVVTMVAGFWKGNYLWVALGGVAVAAGISLLAVAVLWSLERRGSWEPESIGFYLGTGWLLAAVALGIWMALVRAGMIPLTTRFEAIRGFHLRAAFGGFFFNLLFGLSHRLVPMFLVSRQSGRRFAWTALIFLNGGVLFGTMGLISEQSALTLAADGLMALSFAFHFGAAWVQAVSRLRPLGGAFCAYLWGTTSLLPCVFIWIIPRFSWAPSWLGSVESWQPLAVLLPVALLPIVCAVSARIIPFLVWQVNCAPWIGRRKLPSVGALWSEQLLWVEFVALLVLGLVSWAAILWLMPWAMASGAALFAGLVGTRVYNCGVLWSRVKKFNLQQI